MNTDITNFITIVYYKNGTTKVKHDINNEANIYKLLREFGYRKSKLDNRKLFFRICDNDLTPVSLTDIKYAFSSFIRDCEYTNCPEEISHNQIFNWYVRTNPIKENGLFDNYLAHTLTEKEEHMLRLKTNHDFKHKFEINELLTKFEEWSFSKTIDKINSYSSKNPPLYYKKVADNKFLVFNHWNTNTKHTDGFDCWIATYNNEKQIGLKKPLELKDIRLGFRLERDYSLIQDFLN